jgi:hypothetical protein
VLGISQSAIFSASGAWKRDPALCWCEPRHQPTKSAGGCSTTCISTAGGRDLQSQVQLDEGASPERLRIALNADSLATWWAQAMGDFCRRTALLLDLVVEDQTVGLKRMRAGEVAACVCASERPVAGARSLLLGACSDAGQ